MIFSELHDVPMPEFFHLQNKKTAPHPILYSTIKIEKWDDDKGIPYLPPNRNIEIQSFFGTGSE